MTVHGGMAADHGNTGGAREEAEDSSQIRRGGLRMHEADMELYRKMMACSDEDLKAAIADALDVLGEAIRLYGTENCVVSFNAGKDATIILSLYRAAVANHTQGSIAKDRPRLVYYEQQNEPPEALEHVLWAVEEFDLALARFKHGECTSYMDAMERYLKSPTLPADGRAGPLAVVMGTRRGDRDCVGRHVGAFTPGPAALPAHMRVNPLLEWTTSMTWRFVEVFGLRRCSLYDMGLTSLVHPAEEARGDDKEGCIRGGQGKKHWEGIIEETGQMVVVDMGRQGGMDVRIEHLDMWWGDSGGEVVREVEEGMGRPMITDLERAESFVKHEDMLRGYGKRLVFALQEHGHLSTTPDHHIHFSDMSHPEHWLHAVSVTKGLLNMLAGVAIIMWINKLVAIFMDWAGFSFPTAPIGMAIVFFAMITLQAVSPAWADRALFFFGPARNFYKVWVPLFFSAPLVDLPLELAVIPSGELAKILIVIVAGVVFSLTSTATIVTGLLRISSSPPQEPSQPSPSQPGDKPVPAAPQKPPNPWPIALFSLTASAAAFAAGMSVFAVIALSVGAFQLGKALPARVQAFVPPIVSGAAMVSASLCVRALLMDKTWSEELKAYRGPGGPGLVLLSQAAPAVVILGFGLFEQRVLLVKKAVPIAGGALLTTITSLFFTVIVARVLELPTSVGLGLAPRFITLPIALPIAASLGASSSVAAMGVVLQGVLGANVGFKVLDMLGASDPITRGCSMGACAHALGTTTCFAKEPLTGPASAVTFLLTGCTGAALVNIAPFVEMLISMAS